MVLEDSKDSYCEKCDDKHDENHKWNKSCQLNYLKSNFTYWTSENETIDQLIQEMQLKIDSYDDIVFEWIPYDQFFDIKEIGKHDYITVHSAIWKGSILCYNENMLNNQKESQNKKVILKFLCNSQYITYKLLDKVCNFFIYLDLKLFLIILLIYF
jgi:hypothetical protein